MFPLRGLLVLTVSLALSMFPWAWGDSAEAKDQFAAGGQQQARTDLYGDPLPAGAVARLGTVRLRHPGWSPALTFSADGKTLFSSNEDNTLRSWDVATGKAMGVLKSPGERRLQITARSPDGKLLASAGHDGIRLRDLATGRELRRLKTGSVRSLAFTPDGRTLVSGGGEYDAAIRVWDIAAGKERLRLLWHKREVSLVAVTPDGKTLLSASPVEGKVHYTDLATGELLRTVYDPAMHLEAVDAAPDRRTLALAGFRWRRGARGSEPWLLLLDGETGKELRRLVAHENGVHAVAFAPDGKTLVSSSWDRTIRRWEVATGRQLWKVTGVPDGLRCLALSPDGKTLAGTDGSAGILHLWDAATGRALHPDDGPAGYVRAVVFSGDGQLLVEACACERAARVWDAATARQVGVLAKHDRSFLWTLARTPDGKAVASAGSDGTIRLSDLHTGQPLRTLSLPEPPRGEPSYVARPAQSIGFSADGKRLLAVSTIGEVTRGRRQGERMLLAWDLATGREVLRRQEQVPAFTINYPTFSPNGTALAEALGREVVLREAATGKELRKLSPPDFVRSPCAFSPDGKLLAVPSYTPKEEGPHSWWEGYKIRVYDLSTGKERLCLESPGAHSPLCFSPDGQTLAAGAKAIHLWEVATGRERWRSPELDTRVTSLAFSPDGKRLASGLDDTTVLVWDVTHPR